MRFKLSDICDISSGKDIYESERVDGEMPYITSTSQNNGIKYFVSNSNHTIESNAISVNRNGSVGYAFYHKYSALYSNDCRKLKLKNSDNEYVAIFITNQIMQQREKYNYGYKMGTGRLNKQFIMLPVDDNQNPDFDFMEKYVKSKMVDSQERYVDYAKNALENLVYKEIESLEEKEWKEFDVTKLFSKVQRGKRLTKANQIKGDTPYVSSSALNNGVDNYISNSVKVRRFSDCITIANSGSVGSSFYHPYEFVASDHITHLKSDDMSRYVYLFIATMTNRLSEKYNFNREINDKRISREKIMLPIKDDESPDFDYMEQYVINVMFNKYNEYLKYTNNTKPAI